MAQVNRVNIRKIAEEAGVSHITVSRALRGQTNVSEKTRAKIQKVAEKLGYKNNPLVQAYASHIRRGGAGASPACNLVWLRSLNETGGAMHPWQKAFFDGALARAQELGYTLDASINARDYTDEQIDRLLNARGVRGVILPFIDFFDRYPYQREHMATVAIGESPSKTPIHTVTSDYFKNMTTAMDYLLAYGYKRIGFCEHSYSTVLSQGAHWGAYLFNQQRIEPKGRLEPLVGFMSGEKSIEGAREQFLRWLDAEQPDALIVTFSQVKEWLEDEGIAVPNEIALAHVNRTVDTMEWSGVSSGDEQVGAASIDLLTSHILRNEYGIPESPKHMLISGRWFDGITTIRSDVELDPYYTPDSQAHSGEWFEQEFWAQRGN